MQSEPTQKFTSRAEASASVVRVYTTRICPYCVRAKHLLQQRKIAYEEIDVSNDPDTRAWLVEATGGLRTVPQIFIHGKSIGGSDDLHALDRAGELMPLIEAGAKRGD